MSYAFHRMASATGASLTIDVVIFSLQPI